MTRHTPKAFVRGRNGYKRPVNTYLNLLNAKLLGEAEQERADWAAKIKANHLTGRDGRPLANPITHYSYLHPTKGYRTVRF